MRREHNGAVQVSLQWADRVPEEPLGARVHSRCGLIEEYERRMPDERERSRQLAPRAARVVLRGLMAVNVHVQLAQQPTHQLKIFIKSILVQPLNLILNTVLLYYIKYHYITSMYS